MKKLLCVLFAALMLLSLAACGKNADPWQEQYDLGVRYLSEGNYEEAIIAFTAAIEIDPKRAEAYISAADAYLNIGDFDQAEKILQEGYDTTGDETIAELIEKYKEGNYHSSDGRVFRRNGYNENGILVWYHMFTHDIEGKEASITSFDVDGNQTGHVDYVYDAQGRRTTANGYYLTGEVFVIEIEYDSQGNIIRKKRYEPDGTFLERQENTYDAQGRTKTENIYDANDVLLRYDEYEYSEAEKRWLHYNAAGKLTGYDVFTENRQEFYSATGELKGYEVRIYDADGTYLGEERYDGEGNLEFSTVVGSE